MRRRGFGVGLPLVLLLAAVGLWACAAPSAAPGTKPYKLGVILPTTGAYASMGGSEMDTIRLAMEEINKKGINGRKLEIVHDDNEGDPAKSAILLRKQAEQDQVSIVFGTHPTEGSRQMAPYAEEKGIVMITPNPVTAVIAGKKYLFQILNPTELQGDHIARYVTEKFKWKKVAILNDTIAYSMANADDAEKRLKEKGVDVFREQFDTTSKDLSPIWLKVRERKPDGVYLIGSIEPQAVAMKNRKQLGIDIPVVGADGTVSQQFLELVGEAGEGMYSFDYFARSEERAAEGEKVFMKAYTAKYPGKMPLIFEAEGWDATMLAAKALEKGGDDPAKVRDALEGITGFQGALGEYNYSPQDHTGGLKKPMKITQIQKGRPVFAYSLE